MDYSKYYCVGFLKGYVDQCVENIQKQYDSPLDMLAYSYDHPLKAAREYIGKVKNILDYIIAEDPSLLEKSRIKCAKAIDEESAAHSS